MLQHRTGTTPLRTTNDLIPAQHKVFRCPSLETKKGFLVTLQPSVAISHRNNIYFGKRFNYRAVDDVIEIGYRSMDPHGL